MEQMTVGIVALAGVSCMLTKILSYKNNDNFKDKPQVCFHKVVRKDKSLRDSIDLKQYYSV
jgi:hypothetical protein